MKTAVVYYSFSGHAQDVARQEALAKDADLFEVYEARKQSVLSALIRGSFEAFSQKSLPLFGESLDFAAYDDVVIVAPVWAGFPAPAFNSIADMIPAGKNVEVVLTSDSGDTSRNEDKIVSALERRGLIVTHYADIKIERRS